MGLQGENLGLWDYTLFQIGIAEISFEIGIMDHKSNQIGIFHTCKLGLRDSTLFEIGIMGITPVLKLGLRYYRTPPPYGGPYSRIEVSINVPF